MIAIEIKGTHLAFRRLALKGRAAALSALATGRRATGRAILRRRRMATANLAKDYNLLEEEDAPLFELRVVR